MRKIWTAEYYCPECRRSFVGEVYSDNMRELPEEEKEKVKGMFLHYHNMDHHISCWKCKKQIKIEDIRRMIAVGNDAKPLCANCASSAIEL